MSETDEQKTTETQAADDSATKQAKQATNATATTARTEKSRVEQASPRRLSRAIVALVALVALIVIALLLWRYTTQRSAGQPVPAPRTVAMEQSSATDNTTSAPTDETITLPADAVARAGIALETVGEQLAPEGAAQAATGVVQANAYRVTPVVALVGGRVERVSAELGQNVRQGQTVAVVFSDELAQAQARYLAAQADLEEHHKHHQRTTQLVEIGAASREEFEQATTKLRMAEATVAAERQRLLLLGLTPERITALRSSAQI